MSFTSCEQLSEGACLPSCRRGPHFKTTNRDTARKLHFFGDIIWLIALAKFDLFIKNNKTYLALSLCLPRNPASSSHNATKLADITNRYHYSC